MQDSILISSSQNSSISVDSKYTKEETIPCWRGRQGTHPHSFYSQNVKNCISPGETATSIPQNGCDMRYWKVSHLIFQVSKFLLSQLFHWPTTEILKVFYRKSSLPFNLNSKTLISQQKNACDRCVQHAIYIWRHGQAKSLYRQTTRFLPTKRNIISVSKWMRQTKTGLNHNFSL